MNEKLRDAAKAALEELIASESNAWNIINDLEAALAEPAFKDSLTVAEPVAWMSDSDVGFYKEEFGTYPCVPLYAAPPRREWAGLTDEEISQLYKEHAKYQEEGMKLSGWNTFAADVQAKLREKNTMTEDDDLNNVRYKAKYRYETKQPLTEEEIDKAWEWAQRSSPNGVTRITVFARAIEQAHGIGVKDDK